MQWFYSVFGSFHSKGWWQWRSCMIFVLWEEYFRDPGVTDVFRWVRCTQTKPETRRLCSPGCKVDIMPVNGCIKCQHRLWIGASETLPVRWQAHRGGASYLRTKHSRQAWVLSGDFCRITNVFLADHAYGEKLLVVQWQEEPQGRQTTICALGYKCIVLTWGSVLIPREELDSSGSFSCCMLLPSSQRWENVFLIVLHEWW